MISELSNHPGKYVDGFSSYGDMLIEETVKGIALISKLFVERERVQERRNHNKRIISVSGTEYHILNKFGFVITVLLSVLLSVES
jgi:hypothetical protein